MADHPSRNDGDGYDDDPQDDVPDITFSGSGRVTSYEKKDKFSATSANGWTRPATRSPHWSTS